MESSNWDITEEKPVDSTTFVLSDFYGDESKIVTRVLDRITDTVIESLINQSEETTINVVGD